MTISARSLRARIVERLHALEDDDVCELVLEVARHDLDAADELLDVALAHQELPTYIEIAMRRRIASG